jgi:excisionase family DNA binding protein
MADTTEAWPGGTIGPVLNPYGYGRNADRRGQSPPDLYTAEEAAAILRVKRSWLERQAAGRKIPFTMLGGGYRFTSAHLAEIVLMYEEAPAPHIDVSAPGRIRRDGTPGRATGPVPGAPLRPRPRGGPRRAA